MYRAFSGVLALALIFSLSAPCFADFQYTETSKMTGGAAAGAMKMAGIFSKDARQATKGMEATVSVKRNKMRRDESAGEVAIYDLDARKIIHLDLKHKTYYEVTFDEMRAQMEEARRKAAAEQAKHGKSKGEDPQVKIIPRVKIVPGKDTKKILDYTAKEVKTRVDMEVQSQDPKYKDKSGNMWVSADSWIAPVRGYDEVKHFYMRMAKELDWVPGAALGGNAQISPAMVEYRKSANDLNGMPLQSLVSVGMGTADAAARPAKSEEKESSGNPITRGIGGVFSKKKKHDDDDQEKAPAGVAGSLMDMSMEVTSISVKPIDASLFEVPAGFKLDNKDHKVK